MLGVGCRVDAARVRAVARSGRRDPSVALVAAMHPAVLSYWLATTDASQPGWASATARGVRDRRRRPSVGDHHLRTGQRWRHHADTHAAEPDGEASPNDDVPGRRYRLTGDKHFGSGFGISDYMFTTARADDDDAPGLFFMDMRSVRSSGGSEVTVTAEWDGAGMTATQSHAARLEAMPATRLAWTDEIDVITANAAPFVTMVFTAVVLGVFDVAMQFAREQLGPEARHVRAFEQVEWTRADLEHWTAVQAFEGALRTIETSDPRAGLHAGLRAKTAVAEAAEGALRRLAQVLGGGTFSRRSPVSAWFEDVRALGFLRPPWGLAYDGLFATSFGD